MRKSFSLIELMIVIAIMGVLAGLITGNFISSLKKGRDARRKTDLEQLQRALEMYYEDKKSYPTAFPNPTYFPFGGQFCEVHPCPTTSKIYMQRVPVDPAIGNNYVYQSTGTDYKLYSCIENSLDISSGIKIGADGNQDVNGYGISCGRCGNCKYGISSSNINP